MRGGFHRGAEAVAEYWLRVPETMPGPPGNNKNRLTRGLR